MHDFKVLIARTRAVQAWAAPKLKVSADLDGLVRMLENEYRQLHGQDVRSLDALFTICAGVIEEAPDGRAANGA